ncbi:uncharacterized protein BP01DRAFT_380022 [Aspergillus saccharolyticus JOP 1030-1]|uniref:Uncharacterized protein n=1 Tax=Aspergillus saccharolyticus JOP 1030-1 TaxID=1450539 RepID=A0A318ZKS4_9EURO|nr:hypothetical protein BP01DRAFT_380022 [Aspergillus saccharolyticus JOP 1030-1]PYH48106.1 hypothetical protein BP01DRAFT_380022 [Aspergillus saccharolyticus JOP 1030-1]
MSDANVTNPNRPAAERITGHVSSVLDRAGIHHILWGQMAFFVYGVNTDCSNIDFVVDDDEQTRAANNLLAEGFAQETDHPDCTYYGIGPGSHREKVFHIDSHNANEEWSHFNVRLVEMSFALPGTTEIGHRTTMNQFGGSDLVLASDARLLGHFRHERYPVRMLAPVFYLESMLLRYVTTKSWGCNLIRKFAREVMVLSNAQNSDDKGFHIGVMPGTLDLLYTAILEKEEDDDDAIDGDAQLQWLAEEVRRDVFNEESSYVESSIEIIERM